MRRTFILSLALHATLASVIAFQNQTLFPSVSAAEETPKVSLRPQTNRGIFDGTRLAFLPMPATPAPLLPTPPATAKVLIPRPAEAKPKTPAIPVSGANKQQSQPKPCPTDSKKPDANTDSKKSDAKSDSKKKKNKKKRLVDPVRIITGVAPAISTTPDGTVHKWVALTFDDGPDPVYTPQVLSVLKENDVHATFCLIGRQVKKNPELVRQIVAEGHQVASHTMNHDENLRARKDAKIKAEILGDKELIEATAPGAKVKFFRAPGGNWNRHMRELALSWGMKPLGWSVDTKDWQEPGSDQIVETVGKQLHAGGIILMHDAGGNRTESIAALKEIIPALKKDGYEFGCPK